MPTPAKENGRHLNEAADVCRPFGYDIQNARLGEEMKRYLLWPTPAYVVFLIAVIAFLLGSILGSTSKERSLRNQQLCPINEVLKMKP